MKRLWDVLAPAAQGLAKGGGSEAAIIDVAELRKDLAEVERGNRVYLLLCIGMMLTMFVALVCIAITNRNNPSAVEVALGAFGLTGAGLIRWMVTLWRDKYFTELLLALARNMEPKDVRTVMAILREKLLGRSRRGAGAH